MLRFAARSSSTVSRRVLVNGGKRPAWGRLATARLLSTTPSRSDEADGGEAEEERPKFRSKSHLRRYMRETYGQESPDALAMALKLPEAGTDDEFDLDAFADTLVALYAVRARAPAAPAAPLASLSRRRTKYRRRTCLPKTAARYASAPRAPARGR